MLSNLTENVREDYVYTLFIYNSYVNEYIWYEDFLSFVEKIRLNYHYENTPIQIY